MHRLKSFFFTLKCGCKIFISVYGMYVEHRNKKPTNINSEPFLLKKLFYLCTVTDFVETMNQKLSVMFSSVHLLAPHINCRRIECNACYYYFRSLWICFWATLMYGLPMEKMHTFFSHHTSQHKAEWIDTRQVCSIQTFQPMHSSANYHDNDFDNNQTHIFCGDILLCLAFVWW